VESLSAVNRRLSSWVTALEDEAEMISPSGWLLLSLTHRLLHRHADAHIGFQQQQRLRTFRSCSGLIIPLTRFVTPSQGSCAHQIQVLYAVPPYTPPYISLRASAELVERLTRCTSYHDCDPAPPTEVYGRWLSTVEMKYYLKFKAIAPTRLRRCHPRFILLQCRTPPSPGDVLYFVISRKVNINSVWFILSTLFKCGPVQFSVYDQHVSDLKSSSLLVLGYCLKLCLEVSGVDRIYFCLSRITYHIPTRRAHRIKSEGFEC
jgi:putative component of membrane protein insertase Oxa1/YidC/SpoIIIJ protein YidD